MRAGNFTALTGGWMHLCTVNAEGKSACWGNNERGQLGNGTTDDTPNPTPHVRRGADGRGPGGPFDFGLATLNALGNGHSRPYAHDDRFAPSRLRAEWTAEALDALQLDVVGLQETTADQLAAIVRATHGAWQAFQTPETGDRGVETALLWRTSVWQATKLDTIRTQFITRVLPRPVVRLRHRATGRQIWVMDVHNAPWDYQAKRNKAVKAQLAKLAELEATGLPVFYVGDMNEKKTILCKVLRQTGLVTPIGGRLKADGTCVTPKRTMRVDWIFGSKSVGWEGYEQSRDPLVRLSTDHWVPVVRVHVP
jgi:endonuclease/exonuclease/phosphatase family metal-dependent hydrolase